MNIKKAKSTNELKKYLFNEIAKLLVVSLLKISIGISLSILEFQLLKYVLYGADLLVAIAYGIIFMIIIALPLIYTAISVEKSLKIKLGCLVPSIIRLVKEIEKEVIEETMVA